MKRLVDKEVLATVRRRSCMSCLTTQNIQACHIKTRGAYGEDSYRNVIAMCYKCHDKQGRKGWKYMCDNYAAIRLHFKTYRISFDKDNRVIMPMGVSNVLS